MDTQLTKNPVVYQQPDQKNGSRDLNDATDTALETVSYVPNSHMRFWYNVQTENYAPHYHDALEIILCMENPYTVIVQDTEYQMEEGDILFIPPYTMHELICPMDGIRFICMINIDMLENFHDFKYMKPVFSDLFFCNEASSPEIYSEIYSLLMKMIDVYFSNAILWEPHIYSLLIELLSLVGDAYAEEGFAPSHASGHVRNTRYGRISAALYFIDNNFAEDISLEDAASYIGFSKYHFSRLFKKCTNATFYDYLSRRRIQKAQSLLSGPMSVTDIAFQVGFNNITTFSRCFRKFAGCSPSEYRDRLSGK